MHVEERHFVNKKKIEFTIDDYEIDIYRRDTNGVFKITIYSDNKTEFDFERKLHLSSGNVKKEYIGNLGGPLKKPLDDYTYENVKNNLVYVCKTNEEKAKYIDDLLERYLEWYEAKKLIEG